MSRKTIFFIAILVFVALALLLGIQVNWIRNSMVMREANFRRSIDEAVMVTLARIENLYYLKELSHEKHEVSATSGHTNAKELGDSGGIGDSSVTIGHQESFVLNDTLIIPDSIDIDKLIQSMNSRGPKPPPPGNFDTKSHDIATPPDRAILNKYMSRLPIPALTFEIEKHISPGLLDTLLHEELTAKGISLDFTFAVFKPASNRFVLEKPGADKEILLSKGYSFPIFVGANVSSTGYLLLYFPTKSRSFLFSLWGMLLTSILLILIITLAFAFSMFSNIRQKKLSDMKNDFISNMTHEFKTPISTISLACQVLSDNDVQKSDDLYESYIQIISEENRRLGSLAEKILQTAILEKGKLILRLEEINIHELISEVVRSIAMQVEIRDGRISQDLSASDSTLKVDKLHFTNVIYNLLDNANKYSPRKPAIKVATEDFPGYLCIKITDNGVGISKANQKKIFEKLYRVPTGDVHNVKGFGLGLSYVKFVVEKHNGYINIESELNKGSTFSVYIPHHQNPE